MRFWKRRRRTAQTEPERVGSKPASGKWFAMEVKLLAARAGEAGVSRAEVSKLVVTVDPEERSLKGRIAATEETSQKDTG
jgi:hypothetical protein